MGMVVNESAAVAGGIVCRPTDQQSSDDVHETPLSPNPYKGESTVSTEGDTSFHAFPSQVLANEPLAVLTPLNCPTVIQKVVVGHETDALETLWPSFEATLGRTFIGFHLVPSHMRPNQSVV